MPIYKTSEGKWKIANVKGYSKSKKAAVQRLKAIYANKNRRTKW